jgi:hypothetical protein
MRTRSRTLIAVALVVGWVVMVATLGGLAWWKVSHAEPGENDSRVPLMRAEGRERDPLMRAEAEDDDRPGNVPSRPERYFLPPADDKLKLPPDLPLPTVPEAEKPPP